MKTDSNQREGRGFTDLLFDAHLHYEHNDHRFVTPKQMIKLLDKTGIGQALVSSSPDSNTLRLYMLAPDRILPCVRPFDSWKDKWKWQRDASVAARVEEKLQDAPYVAIGEFNLRAPHVGLPGVKAIASLAKQHNLLLHVEISGPGMKELLRAYPGVPALWAHAGIACPPRDVERLIEEFPLLSVELAQRFDIARGDVIDPEWQSLLVRHCDRFLVGSGSSERRILRKLVSGWIHPGSLLRTLGGPRSAWTSARWLQMEDSIRAARCWLKQLPVDVAEKIASRNASQLFANATIGQ